MTKLFDGRAPGGQSPPRCAEADESANTGITPSKVIVGPVGIDRSVSRLDHSFMANRKLKIPPRALNNVVNMSNCRALAIALGGNSIRERGIK
jgi:hypothetical protein